MRMAVLATALAVSGMAIAPSTPANAQSACALSASVCRELIRAPRMYEALYDGSSTLYGFTQNRLKRRVERWAPAMASAVRQCRSEGASPRRIIRNLVTQQGQFDVFASADSRPGDTCFVSRRTD